MGLVYRVNQIFVNKEFALKTIDKNCMSETALRRFQQEARTVFSLDHPNIIAVNDFGIWNDQTPFLVMELVNGETLGDRLARTGCLTLEQAIPIFVQVCFGLAYAHECGVVHRDIKPNNIMLVKGMPLGAEGSIKILDFGIARFAEHEGGEMQSLTRTGEIFGSPLYMSPEQCAGERVDHRADIYSLGCVFFEVLTGAPPCVGENALATMMKHLSETPLTLKQASLGADFPQGIEEIVATMLAKSPDSRYQNIGHIANDLGALKRGDSISGTAKQSGVEARAKAKAKAKTISMPSTHFYALLLGIAAIAGISGYGLDNLQNGGWLPNWGQSSKEASAQKPAIQEVSGVDLKSDLDVADRSLEAVGKIHSARKAPVNQAYLAVKKTSGSGKTRLTQDLLDEAKALAATDRYPQAESLLKRALETNEKALGPQSLDLAELLTCLANCIEQQGRAVEAEPLFNRALAIYEKTLGPNDQHVTMVLMFLGGCYVKQGRAVEAEPLFKRVLTTYEKTLGPNDLMVADSLFSLGDCYFAQGKKMKAEPLYKRALAIYDTEIGPNDPRAAAVSRIKFCLQNINAAKSHSK